ncbi:MAG: response regulator [Eubacterium sp.]|nr:response regulator [Eubacterium sp.]
MLKAILADDEEVILNGLEKMIKWEDFGIEIVAKATDGRKALDEIHKHVPDIVITDVKMPGLTGIELLEKTSEEGLDKIKFIFVSAYQEFDYVKAALSKGAVDYLLKPVRKKDLENVLLKAGESISNQKTVDIFKENKNAVKLRELFSNIDEGYEYTTDFIYDNFVKKDMDAEGKFYVAVCASILGYDNGQEKETYEKRKLLQFVIYNRIVEIVVEENNGFVVKKDDSSCNMVAVIDDDKADNFIEEIIVPMKKRVEEEYNVTICVGIGDRTKDIDEVRMSYNSARFACDLYYFEGREIIDILNIDLPESGEGGGIDEYNRLVERVLTSISTKNDDIVNDIKRTLMQIRIMHYGNREAAISLCLAFAGQLFEKLKNYEMIEGSFTEHQETLLKEINEKKTYSEMAEFVAKYYGNLMSKIYQNMQAKDVSIIIQIKDYMKENYMNDISLKKLAEMACVSPSYFSTFFKTTTGENYKSYLIGIRMEEAVKMVLNTDLKTYEVAEKVGYNNVRRFVDAFKARYGASPMEYRKMYKN